MSFTTTCIHVCLGGITDGVNAELIHTNSGFLLGIRVSWSWSSSVPTDCFQSPIVELSHKTLNIISCNSSVEYFDLDCNQMYRSIVRATFRNVQEFENGNALFFGGTCLYSHCSSKDFYSDSGIFNLGSSMSPPSKLSRVCIGPPTLPEDQTPRQLTSPGTLFPVTFRMVLTSLATPYSTPSYQLVQQQGSLTVMLAFCVVRSLAVPFHAG